MEKDTSKRYINFSFFIPAFLLIFLPLLVFPLFSFHKKDHPVNIKFKHFTVAQGLSQNSIYGITQDKYGYMWFGTMGGLNRFDGYSSRIYQNDKHNPNSLNQDIISTLITDKTGMLWIGTDSGGLARHDPGVGTFTRFTHDSLNPQSIGSNSINTVFEDSTGTLWIGAIQGGLNRFDPLTNTFKRYMPNPQNKFNIIHNTVQCILEKSPGILLIGTPHGIESFDIKSETFARVSPLYARAFCRDKSGNIWIGTVNKGLYLLKPGNEKPQQYFFPFSEFNKINRSMTIHAVFEDKGGAIWIGSNGNGLLKIDEALGRVARYSYEKGNPHSLSSNVITTIFQDSGGIMWFGTNSEGIESFDPMSEVFYDYSPLFAEEEIKNYPRSIYENQKDDLWIGTAGAGLIHYNTQSYLLEYFKHSANDPGTISHDDLFFVEPDYSLPSILWIGTRSGLNRFDIEKKMFRHYFNPTKIDYPQSNYFRCLLAEPDGTLWLGTGGGLSHFNPGTGIFKNFRHDAQNPNSLSDDSVNFIYRSRAGYLWIGTAGGLNCFNSRQGTFKTYFTQGQTLISSQIFSICEIEDGIFFIGTLGDGLVKFDSYQERIIKIYEEKEGLLNNHVYAILKDNKNDLWLSTDSGIYKFNIQTENFTQFDTNDGIFFNQSSINAYEGKSGRYYFSHPKGLVAFYPDRLTINQHIPPIVITDLDVSNDKSDFFPALSADKPIVLSYKNRVITFEFAALDFANPLKNQYKYCLTGFDKNWRDADALHRRVTYTNLDPGNYEFMVKGSNNHGVWNPSPTILKIKITPPFWGTLLFKLTALFLLLGIFSLLHRYRIGTIKAQKERAAADKANRSKSEFLARMSHEIRTPMNAIIGFTEILLESPMSDEQYNYVKTIQRSGDVLLTLINDILDFSKVEAGQLTLEFIEFDPEESACDVFAMILPRIGDKPIEVLCHIEPNVPVRVSGDSTRFQQILVNLIGNAVKFTEAGKIELNIGAENMDDQSVKLHLILKDTGIGIPPDKLESIFEVFHQVDDTITRKYGGSGLGLAICRQLAKLMNGDIWVESEPGKGSTFHFTCLMRRVPDQIETAPISGQKSLAGKRILVVDDNQDNLKLITYILKSASIPVKTLLNGSEVISTLIKAEKEHNSFDACILDINMPGLSGFEVARQIRSLPPPFSGIPLLGLSSSTVNRLKTNETSYFNVFLMKPIQRKRLLEALEHLLIKIPAITHGQKQEGKVTTREVKPREGLHKQINILLAEDNLINQKLAAHILRHEQYHFEIVENGKDAVEKFIANPGKFDLILMDVQMPVMDGIEAVKIIRGKGFKEIPVIAMTAQSMTGDREKCLLAGMNDYVSKPIKKSNFLEVVKKWLDI